MATALCSIRIHFGAKNVTVTRVSAASHAAVKSITIINPFITINTLALGSLTIYTAKRHSSLMSNNFHLLETLKKIQEDQKGSILFLGQRDVQ